MILLINMCSRLHQLSPEFAITVISPLEKYDRKSFYGLA